MEDEFTRFQHGFEFVVCEFNRLVVVVRTYNLKREAMIHAKFLLVEQSGLLRPSLLMVACTCGVLLNNYFNAEKSA